MRNTTCYHIAGTKFLRLASRKVQGFGSNLQNVPDDMRSIYVSDGYRQELRPKYVQWLNSGYDNSIFTDEEKTFVRPLLQDDQAGAEAWIVSQLLKPGNNLDKLFKNKIKPHTYLGIFFPQVWIDQGFPRVDTIRMLPIEKVKTDPGWSALAEAINASDGNVPPKPRYYYVYKQTCHSGNYGIKENTFILNVLEKSGGKIVLSKEEGKVFLDAYHFMVNGLQEWWRELEDQVRSNGGIVWNCLGYPLHFTQEIKEGDLKDVYSACPQSTVGCITHLAYTELQHYIEQSNSSWDILNNNHDSFLTQGLLHDWKLRAAKMREFMEAPKLATKYVDEFHMRSEVQVGFNWGKAHKCPKDADPLDPAIINQYNLDGLREVKL